MGKKVPGTPRGGFSTLTSSLADSYRHLAKVFPFGFAVIYLADPADAATWDLAAINEKASRIAGGSVAGLLNLPVARRGKERPSFHLADLCRDVVAGQRAKRAGRLSFQNATGSREFFAITAIPLRGNCAALLFEDQGLLREAARELIAARQQIAQMCESTGSILWRAEPETLQFTYVTPEAQKILGYWIERWLHESNFFKNRVHPDDWDLVRGSCTRAAAECGYGVHFECRLFSSEGEARWFRVHVRREELSSRRAELAGVMVDITEQKRAAEASRELSMAILRAQERERKTISRELHDSIGQHLTGLNYGLGRLARSRAGSRGVQETVQECLRIVQTCMREIRSVSYMLHPPLLDLMGLGPALRSLVEKFSRQSGIRVEMDVPVRNGAAGALDSDAQMALFRIAQESLTNIQRHARTKSARLRLAYEPASVVLEVEDHGIGIEPSLIEGLDADGGERGLGLLKMRERVTDLKGSLEIQSNGKGTAIRVRIPRPPEKPSKDLMRESGPRGQPKRLRDIS